MVAAGDPASLMTGFMFTPAADGDCSARRVRTPLLRRIEELDADEEELLPRCERIIEVLLIVRFDKVILLDIF